jgi:hypothetical protein
MRRAVHGNRAWPAWGAVAVLVICIPVGLLFAFETAYDDVLEPSRSTRACQGSFAATLGAEMIFTDLPRPLAAESSQVAGRCGDEDAGGFAFAQHEYKPVDMPRAKILDHIEQVAAISGWKHLQRLPDKDLVYGWGPGLCADKTVRGHTETLDVFFDANHIRKKNTDFSLVIEISGDKKPTPCH